MKNIFLILQFKKIPVIALLLLLFATQMATAQFCDQAQGTPGFPSNPGCQTVICAADPFCCSTSWDGLCASAADNQVACCGCVQTQTPGLCAPATPANDACANATPIACGGTATGSTATATTDGPATDCSGGSVAPDVWYTITGTGFGITASLCGSAYDTQIDVYTGACGALTNIGGCSDDFCGLQSQMTWASTLGVVYRIRVHGFGGSTGAFTLNVTCAAPPAPANDACANGTPIACGGTATGSTATATIDGPATDCGGGSVAPDVWYTITGTGGNITASLCGSAYDTQIDVYTGACTGLTNIGGCNDDFCGLQSQMTWASTVGVVYRIRVHGFGGSTGAFTLNVTCAAIPPANNDCANAIPVACGSTTAGTTVNATVDGPATDCGGGSVAPDVWYTIVGTGNGIRASLCGSGYDTQIDVYTGACTGLTNIGGCNDDFCGLQSEMTWASTLGVLYRIRVHGFAGSTGAFTLNVTCAGPLTITCPANAIVPCTSSTAPAVTGTATGSGGCTFVAPVITFTDVSTQGQGCSQFSYLIIRTWRATDACGNTTTCSQTITVQDLVAPTIACPANVTRQCDQPTDPGSTGNATATGDNCAAINQISVTFTDASSQTAAGCTNDSYVITRTWRATDPCGNFSTCVQLITVVDNTAPTIICPGNTTVQCNASTAPAATGTATAVDNCSPLADIAITFTDASTQTATGCGNDSFVITRTWRATDLCGNFSTCIQTITVVDTTPPVITCPANVSVSCTASTAPGAPSTGTVTASAAPNSVSWPDANTGLVGTATAAVAGIPAGATITDVNITLQMDHTWVGDLNMTLTSPAGSVNFMDNPCAGGNSDNINATFNSQGAAFLCTNGVIAGSIPNNCSSDYLIGSAINGNIQTQLNNFNGFNGSLLGNGNWNLAITDEVGGDGGCLIAYSVAVSWSLAGGGTGTGTATATDACGTAVVTFSDVSTQTAGGCSNDNYQIFRTWRATDACGNFSTCVQTITVSDTQAPAITCPAGQTLSCFETVPAPFATAAAFVAGGGTITDNCTANLADFTVFVQNVDNGNDNCPGNARVVTRTYFVQDACGNTTSCTQTFTYLVSTQGPVITSVLPTCFKFCASLANPMESDITFTTDCSFGAVVNITGPQQIGATNCPGTIYRYTYTVTDDCGRTSAPVTRDFIIGNDGPTITCPPFNLFLECGDENNAQYLEDHFGTVLVNTSCELGYTLTYTPQNFNNIACGSSTIVTFTATDACGRTATCSTTVAIMDNTAPTIVSVPPSVCDITNCSADEVFWFNHWKNYMINGIVAEDACDSDVSITAVNTPLNTNCPNGTAVTVVTFVATDNCGNETEITGTFTVEATPSNLNILGKVVTEVQAAVQSVEVTLAGSNIANQMMETGVDGIYGFNGLLAGDNYSVTPYSNDNPMNGVSSYDLVLISKHILQTQFLDSPYKMIAADINRSGSITTLDMVELRKMILHIDEEFVNNTSWRFVEAAFVFPNANNPFATLFPEAAFINGLTESEEHDFVGVKIGDVNGSAVPNAFAGAEDRTFVDDLVFQVKDQELKAGETYEVAFRADNFEAVHGYQFTLNFDKNALTFAGLRAGDLTNMTEGNFGLSLLEEGAITTSWTNEVAQSLTRDAAVFYVSFTANANVLLSEALAVSSRYTRAEAYDGNLDLMDVQFRFDTDGVVTKDFRLYQNTPNPFKQETLIGFDLPEAGAVTLTIFDGSGRLLKQVEGNFAKGYNSVSVSEDALTPGMLYYQLVTESGTATRKMLLHGN
jgi:subtilisin-like proprotein convertase family protein